MKTLPCAMQAFALLATKMELAFQRAIDRFEARGSWEVYTGQAWDFRWGKDHELYHWQEFEEFYTECCEYEWHRAQELMSRDGSFIIPQFLMEEIENDL